MNSRTSMRSARYSESLGFTDGTQSLGPMKGGSKNEQKRRRKNSG